MKLVSQILGSVTPETVSTCAGNLLFISNRQIILSAGDDGRHISLHESTIQEKIKNLIFFCQNRMFEPLHGEV